MVQVELVFGDQAAPRRDVGRVKGREARVAAEDAEDADPLVRAQRGPLAVDRILGSRDRRREADAVLGSLDVVVHRLGHGDELDAVVGKDLTEAQGIVAAYRDEVVQIELLDVVEDYGREVVHALLDLELLEAIRPDVRRKLAGLHLARVRPGRVQPRAAGAIDRAGIGPIERHDVVRIQAGARLHVGQAFPAAPDAHDLVAKLSCAIDDALDDGIEAGDVAASREDADAGGSTHACLPWMFGRSRRRRPRLWTVSYTHLT